MTALLASLDSFDFARRLGSEGVAVRLGPFVTRIHTRIPEVVRSIRALYGSYPLVDGDFIDFDVGVRTLRTALLPWRKQVGFELDGRQPFNPLPGPQGLPLLEWGLNWCVYSHAHQYLIIHAAVLEREGDALVLPAPSGSGKSTLCAALMYSGWRLLSDELTLIDPTTARVTPMPRPVSLKNQSIGAIQRFSRAATLGSLVRDTSKGTVAHLVVPEPHVRSADRSARIRWIAVPRYRTGAAVDLRRMQRAEAFMTLVENSFNYDLFGVEGFELLSRVIDDATGWHLEYDDLTAAVDAVERLRSPAFA